MKCQQFQLYAAEAEVPKGRHFNAVDEAASWVNAWRDTWWWTHRRWDTMIPIIEVGPKPASSNGSVGAWIAERNCGRIEMHPTHMNEQDIIHEASHVIAARVYDSKSHDPYFAATYLDLTYYLRGSEVYLQLYEAFQKAGIEHDLERGE